MNQGVGTLIVNSIINENFLWCNIEWNHNFVYMISYRLLYTKHFVIVYV